MTTTSSSKIELEDLRELIRKEVIVFYKKQPSPLTDLGFEPAWTFDFRNILLRGNVLDSIASIFTQKLAHLNPYQVGGLETASLPLIAAMVARAPEYGGPSNGFYIRKSRKPMGLKKNIEGHLTDEKIVLVDDLMNSGTSIIKQIETLKQEGKTVSAIAVLVTFRSPEYYEFATKNGIEIISLFSLKDFGLTLSDPRPPIPHDTFVVDWSIASANPNYFYRVPKSAPALDDARVYFGSDSGLFWAVNQADGTEAWRFKMFGFHAMGKNIFSSPALHGDLVYFGAYDGNVYALERSTGTKKWTYMEADWVGSSPTVAPDLGLLFIGLEFGLWNKKGGIVALELNTGEKKWEFTMPDFVHSSPCYIPQAKAVAIGSNNKVVYLFDARTGKVRWTFNTGGEIKASFAYDEKRGYLFFGSFDSKFYILNIQNGEVVLSYKTGGPLFSTPFVYDDKVFVTSTDKNVYAFDLNSLEKKWQFPTGGRILSDPRVFEGQLFVGSNDGRLYEVDCDTGRCISFFQFSERITNRIAYNGKTKKFFVLTYANELHCLRRRGAAEA